MAQEGNSRWRDAERGRPANDGDDNRWRGEQQGDRGRHDFRPPQSSFSDRGDPMGGYYTGADRNYGGGQGNYGTRDSDDWGSSRSGGWASTRGNEGAYGDEPGSGRGPEAGGRHWDPDYHQWRAEQMRNLDNDYAEWRRARYKKFSEEFNSWRDSRSGSGGSAVGDATGSASSSAKTTSSAHDTSTSSIGKSK